MKKRLGMVLAMPAFVAALAAADVPEVGRRLQRRLRKGRVLVSPSVGCVLGHPVFGFDLAAVCKKR